MTKTKYQYHDIKFAVRLFTFTTYFWSDKIVSVINILILRDHCVSRALSIFQALPLPHLKPSHRPFFLMVYLKCSFHKMVTGTFIISDQALLICTFQKILGFGREMKSSVSWLIYLDYMYLPYVAEASPAPLEAPPTGPPLIIMPPCKMKSTFHFKLLLMHLFTRKKLQ